MLGVAPAQQVGQYVQQPGTFYLVNAIVVFTVTSLIGFTAGAYFNERATTRNLIAFLITLVWAISNLAQIAVPGYQSSIYLHGVMGATIGYLYGVSEPVTRVAEVLATGSGEQNSGNTDNGSNRE